MIKSHQRGTKIYQRGGSEVTIEAKGYQKGTKGHQRGTEGHQRESKGHQRGTKSHLKATEVTRERLKTTKGG